MKRMKKILISVGLIIILIGLNGCKAENSNTSKPVETTNTIISSDNNDSIDNLDKNETIIDNNTTNNDNEKLIFWCEGFSVPVPKPEANYIVVKEFGTICYEFSKTHLDEYLEKLVKDGWNLYSSMEIQDKENYIYIKDDMNLQIIDNTNETKENTSINDFIIVSLHYGNDEILKRENALNKVDAFLLIEDRIKELDYLGVDVPFNKNSSRSMIVERYIEESYEKMGLQAFYVVDENGNLVRNFFICNNYVLPILDTLTDTCVADIDADGEYELLSLYGWGSGLYRIELTAYKNVNPIYFSSNNKILQITYRNCFVPKDGYGKLSLTKISDNEIHLLDHDWKAEDSDSVVSPPTDYGKILLDTDGYHLIPEIMENFPYDQWDYSYDKSNLKTKLQQWKKNKTNEALQEPPEINITIGDTKLDYEIKKVNWNGEKASDDISFVSLMESKDNIPVFENPGSILEYKDSIVLDFGNDFPDSIKVMDYLLTEDGRHMYNEKLGQDRVVRIEDDGTVSYGLYQHMALMLSSSMLAYENPSYRGFRVLCTFGEKECEYVFVLSLEANLKN
ncbi:MAG: hypothetical protein K0S41_2235 [Anaerocolumna sp.]|nr:hypothetical protein [Anaerocolumna sp.]